MGLRFPPQLLAWVCTEINHSTHSNTHTDTYRHTESHTHRITHTHRESTQRSISFWQTSCARRKACHHSSGCSQQLHPVRKNKIVASDCRLQDNMFLCYPSMMLFWTGLSLAVLVLVKMSHTIFCILRLDWDVVVEQRFQLHFEACEWGRDWKHLFPNVMEQMVGNSGFFFAEWNLARGEAKIS